MIDGIGRINISGEEGASAGGVRLNKDTSIYEVSVLRGGILPLRPKDLRDAQRTEESVNCHRELETDYVL